MGTARRDVVKDEFEIDVDVPQRFFDLVLVDQADRSLVAGTKERLVHVEEVIGLKVTD